MLDRMRQHSALLVEREDEQARELLLLGELEDRRIAAQQHAQTFVDAVLRRRYVAGVGLLAATSPRRSHKVRELRVVVAPGLGAPSHDEPLVATVTMSASFGVQHRSRADYALAEDLQLDVAN